MTEPRPPAAKPLACPNSLDTTETSVGITNNVGIPSDFQAPMTPDQPFRHSGWAIERQRVRAAMVRTSQTGRRVEAFDDCGKNAWIYQNADSPLQFKMMCDRCHDRLCTPCARERSWKIKNALATQMGDKAHSFITLTLSGKGETLCELVDRLYKSFRYLRASALWEERVAGGAAFLEIKWNDKANRWHPHLHIICEAKFIVQAELSNQWRAITRDSFIVDVRRVSTKSGQVKYVTKYASKPLNTSFSHDPDRLDEAVVALKGRRLCLCFGSWYGTKLQEAEESDLEDEIDDLYKWQNVGSLHEIHARAAAGEEFAIRALSALGARRIEDRDAQGNSS